MVRSRARLTSAGSTAYNQETLVIPLSAKPNHAAVLMATTIPCKIHIPLRLPRPLTPNKTASKQNRAARQLRTCRWSRRPLNLSPFALAQISGGHATKSRALQLACRRAAAAAGLSKSVTVHTLRHSFATHLLEQGVDIRVIQDLLGHRHIKSTVGYARVAIDMIRQVQSPLELLNMAATAPD